MHSETKQFDYTQPPDSLGGLLGDLMRHSTALIKGEIALIRSELNRKIDIGRTAAIFIAIGFVFVLLSGMALLSAGIMALGAYIGLIASALICGVFVGVTAIVLVWRGLGQFKRLTN